MSAPARCPSQLCLERLGMIIHRLERILGPAEHASKPGYNLLPLEPLSRRRDPRPDGGNFSGTIPGGFLTSGSSSSKERSISGTSVGRGGFLMMIGSPGGRPGGLGRGSGIGVSSIVASTSGQQSHCSRDRVRRLAFLTRAEDQTNSSSTGSRLLLEIMVRARPLATEPEAGAYPRG